MPSKNFSANLNIGAKLASSVGRVFGGLNSKIKSQEATLKSLRAAYKEAGKGTGEYAGKLDQLGDHITKAEAKLLRLRKAASFKLGGALGGIGSTFLTDAKRLALGAGIVTGAVAATGGAVFAITKGFVDWADDIGDTAEALGMSTQALQTWQYAAATVGVDSEKTSASIAKFNKTIADGADGTKEIIQKLGINFERLSKSPLDEQLTAVAEGFKRYKGEGNKAAMAATLFGRSGYKLTGILSKGADGLEAFRKSGEKTGAVLDDNAAKAASDAADSFDKFGMTMLGLRNTIAVQFVPALGRLIDKLSDFLRNEGPNIKKWASDFALVIEEKVVPKISEWIEKMPAVIDKIKDLALSISKGIEKLKDFVGGWENLGIALLALNFAPTILGVGNLIVALARLAVSAYGTGTAFGIMWGAVTGPVGLVVAALSALFLVVYHFVNPGGPLDLLGKMFPDTMKTIDNAVRKTVDWVSDTIDKLIAKIEKFFGWLGKLGGWKPIDWGFPAGPDPRQYDLPRMQYDSATGTEVPGSSGAPPLNGGPLNGVQLPAPNASKQDILDYLKPQSSNNTYQINVTTPPGADGAEIGRSIRREFQRKPLYDMDGALLPA